MIPSGLGAPKIGPTSPCPSSTLLVCGGQLASLSSPHRALPLPSPLAVTDSRAPMLESIISAVHSPTLLLLAHLSRLKANDYTEATGTWRSWLQFRWSVPQACPCFLFNSIGLLIRYHSSSWAARGEGLSHAYLESKAECLWWLGVLAPVTLLLFTPIANLKHDCEDTEGQRRWGQQFHWDLVSCLQSIGSIIWKLIVWIVESNSLRSYLCSHIFCVNSGKFLNHCVGFTYKLGMICLLIIMKIKWHNVRKILKTE